MNNLLPNLYTLIEKMYREDTTTKCFMFFYGSETYFAFITRPAEKKNCTAQLRFVSQNGQFRYIDIPAERSRLHINSDKLCEFFDIRYANKKNKAEEIVKFLTILNTQIPKV